MKRTLLFLLLAVLASCGPTGEGREWLENAQDRADVSGALIVQHTDGAIAEVFLYFRNADDHKLHQIRHGRAFVGQNGIGKEREGDRKTPRGEMGIETAFGILPNPGTVLPYIDIVPGTYACDCCPEFYNRIIDTAAVHHNCKGEDMAHIAPEYNYGVTTTFNSDNEWMAGSNIFVHCKGKKSHTMGCVALNEKMMKELLAGADNSFKIFVY